MNEHIYSEWELAGDGLEFYDTYQNSLIEVMGGDWIYRPGLYDGNSMTLVEFDSTSKRYLRVDANTLTAEYKG
jgi:hypothetical protein